VAQTRTYGALVLRLQTLVGPASRHKAGNADRALGRALR
jgi:hypothetical protein